MMASDAAASTPSTVAGDASTATNASDSTGTGSVAAVPSFDWGGSVSASEAYTSNASGISGADRSDFISTLGFSAFVHEHSRRVVFDANYSFGADFYARGTNATQITNNLEAVGAIAAIPDYLNINARAFAAPIVTSNLGVVTAGNRVVPNGFKNSYGYYVEPDLKFRLGHFATSETTATYGSEYFTNPAGTVAITPIPGLAGPQDTTTRTLTETFSSGEDFDRFNWIVIGDFSESDRKQGLLSEKAGIANLRYAFTHEFSLLATVGYDAVTNTTPLTRNISGLVAMGGIGLTFGEDFSFQAEAGRKYNDMSYLGSLRYNLSPRTSIVAALNDSVSTPEGQLLDSLSNLTSTASGALTTSDSILGDGTPASLSSFNPNAFGTLNFNQNITRFQTASLSFMEDFERNHASLTLFGSRQTILSGIFLGPPRTTSWGGNITLSRDISELTLASLGSTYSVNQQLGGTARTISATASVKYAMSRAMNVYLQGDYVDRQSSASLIALSPFTGSLTDYRITIGISRTL